MNNRLIVSLIVGMVCISSVTLEAKNKPFTFINATGKPVYVYYGEFNQDTKAIKDRMREYKVGKDIRLDVYDVDDPTYFFVSFDNPKGKGHGFWFEVAEDKTVNVKLVNYLSYNNEVPMLVPNARLWSLKDSDISYYHYREYQDDIEKESIKDAKKNESNLNAFAVTF